jgi:hypothetical protein
MKTTIFLVSAIVFLFSFSMHAQQATATIQTVTECPGNEVVVSLDVENFINVGAMTLYIGYDTAQLQFETITNIHPSFAGIFFNAMVYPQPQIGISFSSLYGTSLPSGKLFDMVFNYIHEEAPLVFNSGCELTTPDFQNIPVTYTDGGVNPLIHITNQPADTTVYLSLPASFTVAVSGGESFQWQRSTNAGVSYSNLNNGSVYQGVNTAELLIQNTNQFINGSLYKCRITTGDCIVFSDSALLTLVEPEQQNIPLNQGWNSLASHLDPTNADPDNLFAGIMSSLVIVIAENGVYQPSTGTNTIGEFDPKKGYVIKMSSSEQLTISGAPLNDHNLTVPEGWSYLPVIVDCDVDIETLFSKHLSQLEIIQELPGVNVYWPEMGITTLLILNPGKSYLVKMKSEVGIGFPECE